MKYFLHDCNSFNDDKVSELFLNFGYEGLGLFYTILERIGAQEKPIKTIVLKNQLNVGKKLDKCWLFMEEIGLIKLSDGKTWAPLFDRNYNTNRIAYKSQSEWKIITNRIFTRDNHICQYCGSDDHLECDHIVPFSKGGSEDDDNLLTACRACNRRKSNKPVSDFLKSFNPKTN